MSEVLKIQECEPKGWKSWLLEVSKLAPAVLVLAGLMALYFQTKAAAATTQEKTECQIQAVKDSVQQINAKTRESLARLEEGQKYIIKTLDELKSAKLDNKISVQ